MKLLQATTFIHLAKSWIEGVARHLPPNSQGKEKKMKDRKEERQTDSDMFIYLKRLSTQFIRLYNQNSCCLFKKVPLNTEIIKTKFSEAVF